MYVRGNLPTDFDISIMIPIPEKSNGIKSENHRAHSLVTHASKTNTNIVFNQMEEKVETVLSEDRFCFRKKQGTRQAILALKLIIEKRTIGNITTNMHF